MNVLLTQYIVSDRIRITHFNDLTYRN